ncbi:beta-hexosaminidase subunit alpha-like [Cydia strobilella]|uniref:beta-hexosaminidase subunit alpha-like n=1 Tax=Cydia strobilella TaxID=1100964 RepID=UPI003006C69B
MMVRCVLLLSALVVFSQAIVPGPKYIPTKGEIWPKPQYEKKDKAIYLVDKDKLEFKVTKKSCQILTDAIQRAKKTLHKLSKIAKRNYNGQNVVSSSTLGSIDVELTQPCEAYPYHGMDESYNLTVSDTASLTGHSIWGVLHGLESFLHLLYQSDDYESLLIQGTKIHDYPRHPHRGLLLDTSRHYLRVSKLLTTLDAMAMNKLNVFHWHIVDDHSFPYQSEKFPELSEKGAYHSSMVYTKADIKKIVEYARNRGIRVIPEIDVPGHVRSWGEAYPQLLTPCYTGKEVTSLGPLDPTNEHTYKFLGQLLEEVREWFPDGYLHLGGDEVDSKCWISNPSLLRYMMRHNMSSWTKLHSLFMERATPLVGDRKVIVWEEVFDEKVPLSNDTVVQIWLNAWAPKINEVLEAGKKALFSSEWYLSVLGYGGDWENFYKFDPRLKVSDRALVHNMIGGEACMWGEYVDSTNFIQRVWPRACGIAERLWSEASRDDIKAEEQTELDSRDSTAYKVSETMEHVRRRIEEQACRMLRRGVPAEPPNGPGFCVV